MHSRFFVFLVFYLLSASVFSAQDKKLNSAVCQTGTAVADGVSNATKLLPGASAPWDVAGSLIYVKCMYETLNTQLQTMKEQSRFLSDVKYAATESVRQYDAINNVSLDAIKSRLEGDADSLTLLDNTEGMDDRKKLDTMIKELNRRIEDPKTMEEERKRLAEQSAMAASLKRLSDLDQATDDNLARSAGAINERESVQLSSQSLAILAKLQVLEDRRQYEEYLARGNDRRAQNSLSQPSNVYDKMGSHERSSIK